MPVHSSMFTSHWSPENPGKQLHSNLEGEMMSGYSLLNSYSLYTRTTLTVYLRNFSEFLLIILWHGVRMFTEGEKTTNMNEFVVILQWRQKEHWMRQPFNYSGFLQTSTRNSLMVVTKKPWKDHVWPSWPIQQKPYFVVLFSYNTIQYSNADVQLVR